jgi:hypothetical protein
LPSEKIRACLAFRQILNRLLEPRREQAQRDNGKKRGAVVSRRSVTTDDFGLDEEL